MLIYKRIILAVFLLAVLLLPNLSQAKDKPELHFFWAIGCPHCAEEEAFLDQMEEKYDDQLDIERYEVSRDLDNAKLMKQMGQELDIDVQGVPFTVVGDQHFIGYLNDATTGAKIEQAILSLIGEDSQEQTSSDKISLPVFGEIDLKSVSLPIITIMIGVLDGFNPCAMWALLFLISLLLGMKDRKRMWILGTTFIVASALVYFIFMAAWLNLILFLGFIIWVRVVIALIAMAGGGWNIRNYIKKRKEDGCEVVDTEKRKKVFDKLKNLTQQNKFWLALAGIVALAFAVNLVELICSAGLPAVYTQVLILNNLPTWQYYGYILLYVFFFMIDDLFVFFVAMITLKMTGISTKYSKWSSLIGGAIMVIIGLLLLFKPEWLMFG